MRKTSVALILAVAVALGAQDKKDEKKTVPGGDAKGEKKINTRVDEGFEGAQWNKLVSEIKDTVKGKLDYTDFKTIIISRDGELEYTYGFFYVEPEKQIENGKEKKADTDGKSEVKGDDKKADEGKLFYVSLTFPYLPLKDVRTRLEKYGDPTDEKLVNNKGVIAWNGNNTVIMMWVDEYRKEPYCRRIVYVNKQIIEDLKKEKDKIFRKTERDILEKLDQLYGKTPAPK